MPDPVTPEPDDGASDGITKPGDVLIGVVRAGLLALGGILGWKKLTDVYRLFKPSFQGELANWRTCTRPPTGGHSEFTRALIRIFQGTEDHWVSDWQNFGQIAATVVSPEYAKRFSRLVESLSAYEAKISKEEQANSDLAIDRRFTRAVETLPSPRQATSAAAVKPPAARAGFERLLPFPYHIQDIISLVEGAQESVVIHADAVDYGSFREFDSHRRLVDALIQKAKAWKKTKARKKVEFLIWTDYQPMSLANKFKAPGQRALPEFEGYVREYLRKLVSVAATEEYKEVERCLARGADWVDRDIGALVKLQLIFHGIELKELRNAGVVVRGSDREADLQEVTAPMKGDGPILFYWIVDRARAIIVTPSRGHDATAFRIDDRDFLREQLTTFDEIFNRPPSRV